MKNTFSDIIVVNMEYSDFMNARSFIMDICNYPDSVDGVKTLVETLLLSLGLSQRFDDTMVSSRSRVSEMYVSDDTQWDQKMQILKNVHNVVIQSKEFLFSSSMLDVYLLEVRNKLGITKMYMNNWADMLAFVLESYKDKSEEWFVEKSANKEYAKSFYESTIGKYMEDKKDNDTEVDSTPDSCTFCDSCIHEPVCKYRESYENMNIGNLDSNIFTVIVKCRYYIMCKK